MRTIRTIRLRLPHFGLALCTALLSGCFGPTPRLQIKVLTGWDQWKTSKGAKDSTLLRDGETMKNWTEQVDIRSRPAKAARQPRRTT